MEATTNIEHFQHNSFHPRSSQLTSSSLGLEVLDIAGDGNKHAVVSLGCDTDRGRDVGLDAQTLVGQSSVHGQVDGGERGNLLLVEIVNQGRVRVESGTGGVPKCRFIIRQAVAHGKHN